MSWVRRSLDRWRDKSRSEWLDLNIRRAELAALDTDQLEVAALLRLVRQIRRDGTERRTLALLLLRQDLEAIVLQQQDRERQRRAV